MSEKHLTIIGSTPGSSSQPSLVQETLHHWSEDDRPTVVYISIDDAVGDARVLDKTRVAWVQVDEEAKGLFELVGLLQDLHIPAMLTRPNEDLPVAEPFQMGIVVAPPYAPPLVRCGMLRTLWSQGDVVDALRSEIKVLQAHQGGLCDQIGKIDEELRLAAQLQREFLPNKLPQVGSVEFRVLYRPAGYVSGDIYDVIRLDEHHVGFYLADAVGHGVPAALMTVFIKRSLPTKEITPGVGKGYRLIPPNEALARLNADMLKQQTQKVHFATACYGIIDTRTLEMQFARAGHPFPMVFRADGEIEWMDPEGGLLGVFPDEEFELGHIQLRPGDRLLMYSDGFEVAFPETEQTAEGEHRLVNSMRYTEEFKDLARGSMEDVINQLARKLDQQVGSLNQLDDMTALLVGVHPPHDAEGSALRFDEVSKPASMHRSSA